MWHSEADIINDLAALNDFGQAEETEPYKILCSIGRGSKAEKKPEPKTVLDPRTGEEFKLSDNCLSLEDILCRGKGRGSILNTRSYALLQKQLRLARPLGSGDEIIESYCKRNNSPETSPNLSGFESPTRTGKSSDSACLINSIKMKSRVKGVRNSNLLNNALMTSLLRAKEISLLGTDIEESNIASEPKGLNYSNGNCAFDFPHNDLLKNESSKNYSPSENLVIWQNGEDAPSESAYNSYKSSNTEELLDKIKAMGDESRKSFSFDLSEDLDSDESFSAEDEVECAIKKENGERDISGFMNAEEKLDRNEIYKKLGEKLNKINMSRDQRRNKEKSSFSVKKLEPMNKFWGSQDSSFPKNLVKDEINFPPLV